MTDEQRKGVISFVDNMILDNESESLSDTSGTRDHVYNNRAKKLKTLRSALEPTVTRERIVKFTQDLIYWSGYLIGHCYEGENLENALCDSVIKPRLEELGITIKDLK